MPEHRPSTLHLLVWMLPSGPTCAFFAVNPPNACQSERWYASDLLGLAVSESGRQHAQWVARQEKTKKMKERKGKERKSCPSCPTSHLLLSPLQQGGRTIPFLHFRYLVSLGLKYGVTPAMCHYVRAILHPVLQRQNSTAGGYLKSKT